MDCVCLFLFCDEQSLQFANNPLRSTFSTSFNWWTLNALLYGRSLSSQVHGSPRRRCIGGQWISPQLYRTHIRRCSWPSPLRVASHFLCRQNREGIVSHYTKQKMLWLFNWMTWFVLQRLRSLSANINGQTPVIVDLLCTRWYFILSRLYLIYGDRSMHILIMKYFHSIYFLIVHRLNFM